MGETIRAYIEEKRNEVMEKNLNDIEKSKTRKKTKIPKLLEREEIEVQLPDKILTEVYLTELNENLYLNRGYILDGVLDSYYQTFRLFKTKKEREPDQEEEQE